MTGMICGQKRGPACGAACKLPDSAGANLNWCFNGFMNIDFTPDQQCLVQRAIESGRFRSPEDAAQEAFSLWAERERRRTEILAAVDDAEASLARGKGRSISTQEESRQLANHIAQRGKARLAHHKPATR